MKTDLMQTGIPGELSTNLKIKQLEFTPAWAYKLYEVVFKAMAETLSVMKEKDKKVAVCCRDLKDNLILGATLKYIDPEEASEETVGGNWIFQFTTDKEDIEDAVKIINFNDHQFQRIFTHVGIDYAMKVNDSVFILEYCTTAITTLLDHMEANIKEGDVYEVEEAGFFIATAGVENGERAISVTPGDTLKTIIKDDTVDQK